MKKLKNLLRLSPILLAFIGLTLTGFAPDGPTKVVVQETDFLTTLHDFESLRPTPLFINTNYYFSVSGSTGNTGLSPSSPWPESKINTVGVGGDTLKMLKGDKFTGTFVYSRSGVSGNPIVFDLYGSATNNACFDGNATTSAPVITISGNYIKLNNLVIQNSKHQNGVVFITSGIHDVTLYNCYINTGIRGVNAYHCGTGGVANIKVLNCWFYNISDVADSHPNGGGSHVQLNNCTGSGQEIGYCWSYTADPSSANNFNYGVGDVYSLYQSNGTPTSPIWVHDNKMRGGANCQTTGYIGITLLDDGGSYQLVENNILVNPGQGGIGIMPGQAFPGGHNATVQNNRMYCKNTGNTHNYVGMGFNDLNGVGNCTMQGNHITWYPPAHAPNPYNKYSFQTPPAGWNTNTADNAVDALASEGMLPNPLWTGSPWNTATVAKPSINYPSAVSFQYGTSVVLNPSLLGSNSVTVNTSLPSGLSLNSTTGQISGTPTAATSTASYIFTATNGTGSTKDTVSITVNAAPLVIRADMQYKKPGAVNPTLTASYYGLVNGDTAGSLTTPPSITTTAVTGSVVGVYPITATGAVSVNYNISYIDASLVVFSGPVLPFHRLGGFVAN